MRNPASVIVRLTVRAAQAATVVALTLPALLLGVGAAHAAEGSETRAETNSVALGLLGPVGVVAVVLGVLGMAVGVARSRKKSTAVAAPRTDAPRSAANDLADEPTKRLAPVRGPAA